MSTNAPYHINQGQSKLGRDQVEIAERLGTEFSRADRHRQVMIQQTDRPTGTLTVRSDNTSGMVTLVSGHGVVTGQTVDVFFAGGMRAGVTAGTVDGNNVPFSAGTGDNLPAQDATVTVEHYKTVANVFKFHTGDGTTIDPNIAYRAFKELASFCAVCEAALQQFVARFKQ